MTTRLQAETFLNTVIEPALQAVQLWSPAAGVLLLGTAIQESELCYRRQIGGGPALGLFQMEPDTYQDCHDNYLKYRSNLLAKVLKVADRTEWPEAEWLVTHDRFAAVMARVKYLRAPAPLPHAEDIPAMAEMWKTVYNGPGKGSVQAYLDSWHAVMGE